MLFGWNQGGTSGGNYEELLNEGDIGSFVGVPVESPGEYLWGIKPGYYKFWSKQSENNPHYLLARLRMPIYITTSPGNLLAAALRRAGADPQVRICPWWGDETRIPAELWEYNLAMAEQGRPYWRYGYIFGRGGPHGQTLANHERLGV